MRAEEWQACLEWFDQTCAYCGVQQSFWHVLEQEHVIPVSKEGGYTANNIVPACRSCNSSKRDKAVAEWLGEQYSKAKARQVLERIEAYFEGVSEQED